MGYYIQTNSNHNKAETIAKTIEGAKIVTLFEAREAINDKTLGVIVVVDNGMFEAAGFAYADREFAAFTKPTDRRPKKFVVMPRVLAEQHSGYRKEKADASD